MKGDATSFERFLAPGCDADSPCRILRAVHDALAILDAIDQGNLFEELPEDEAAIERHETGLTLLHILEDRLRAASGYSQTLAARKCAGSKQRAAE